MSRLPLDQLRLIVDGFQGFPYPLNRTSLHELFDEIETNERKLGILIAAMEQIRGAIEAGTIGQLAYSRCVRLANQAMRDVAILDKGVPK